MLDDGSELRAPIVGVVAGLRAAAHETVVFLPVDCPLVTPELLRALGRGAGRAADRARCPAPTRRPICPSSSDALAAGELSLRGVNPTVLESMSGCSPTRTRPRSSQRSNRTSPLSTSSGPDSASTRSRPSRSIRAATPAVPSTVTRRPWRKLRAPRSS